MLSLFRTNQVVFSVLFFLYAFLLRIPLFFVEAPITKWQGGIFSAFLQDTFGAFSTTTSILLSSFLVGVLGILANNFVLTHRLASVNNLFPGLFTVLLASLLPIFLWPNAYQLANICLMLSLLALAKTYRTKNVSDYIFNVGWWIGIASMFMPHYLLFMLMAFAAMNTLRAARFREQFVLLSGGLVPYILVGFWYFWNDRFTEFMTVQFGQAYKLLEVFQNSSIIWYEYIAIALLALLLVIVLFNYSRYQFKTTMENQKKINLMYWTLFLAGFSTLFIPFGDELHLQTVVIPIGVLLSFNFSLLSRGVAEVLHLVLVLALVILIALYFPGLL